MELLISRPGENGGTLRLLGSVGVRGKMMGDRDAFPVGGRIEDGPTVQAPRVRDVCYVCHLVLPLSGRQRATTMGGDVHKGTCEHGPRPKVKRHKKWRPQKIEE